MLPPVPLPPVPPLASEVAIATEDAIRTASVNNADTNANTNNNNDKDIPPPKLVTTTRQKPLPHQKNLSTEKNREFLLGLLLIIDEIMKFDEIPNSIHENKLWKVIMVAFFHHSTIGKAYRVFRAKDRPERNFKSLVIEKVWPNMVRECTETEIQNLEKTHILGSTQYEGYQRYLHRMHKKNTGDELVIGEQTRVIPIGSSRLSSAQIRDATAGMKLSYVIHAADRARQHLKLQKQLLQGDHGAAVDGQTVTENASNNNSNNNNNNSNNNNTAVTDDGKPFAALALAAAKTAPPTATSPKRPTTEQPGFASETARAKRVAAATIRLPTAPSVAALASPTSNRRTLRKHPRRQDVSDSSCSEEEDVYNDAVVEGQLPQLRSKRTRKDSSYYHTKKRHTMKIHQDDDCLNLNVGGTIFLTSKKSLCYHSVYFRKRIDLPTAPPSQVQQQQALSQANNAAAATVAGAAALAHAQSQALSQANNTTTNTQTTDGSGDNNDTEPLPSYIHHDPEAFQVLWKYMRDGYLYSNDITHGVLMQAEYFGVTKLVQAVKCAYRPLQFNGIQDFDSAYGCTSVKEISQAFDSAYGGGILSAMQRGILPPQFEPKEYAHLVIDKNQILITKPKGGEEEEDDLDLKEVGSPISTFYTYVEAPSYLLDEEGTPTLSPLLKQVRKDNDHDCCCTFLEAINWLQLHGFTTRERKHEQRASRSNTNREHLWFSRKADKSSLANLMKDCPIILTNTHDDVNNTGSGTYPQRQFAAHVYNKGKKDQFVLADTGMEEELKFLPCGEDKCPPPKDMVKSNITRHAVLSDEWLRDRGYTQLERGIGEIFERIYLQAMDPKNKEDCTQLSVSVYSRKLEN